MGRKRKYENAEIVKDILSREASSFGDIQLSLSLKYIDFKSEEDKKYLANNIKGMLEIFNNALKELEWLDG